MLSKASQEKILKALKVPDEKIAELLAADKETEHDITGLHIFTDADLATVKDNVKRGAIEAAPDLLAKQLREELGVETTSKNLKEIAELHAAKQLEGSKQPFAEKETEYKNSIKNLQDKLKEATDIATAKDGEIAGIRQASEIKSLFPEKRGKFLTDDEYLDVLRREYTFEQENGKPVVKKGGTLLKDNLENPLSPKDVIEKHFAERKWIEEQQTQTTTKGRGGSNSNGGAGVKKFGTHQEMLQHIADNNGGNTKGIAAQKMYNELLAANPDLA